MTHGVTVLLAFLGVVGQVLLAALVVVALLRLLGVRGPLAAILSVIRGYELWAAFVVSAVATGGSLFFSEVAGYVPCELCWYQRICMYPLVIVTLLAALARDNRVARYLLVLPLVGIGLAIYQLLIERGVVSQTQACLVSAPGGCATKWIEEFGYMTIPLLSLTAFLLVLFFLTAAAIQGRRAPVPARAEGPARQRRTRSDATVEAALMLIVLGLVAVAALAGWAVGHGAKGTSGSKSTTTAPGIVLPGGGQAAGRTVFASAGCGACHTFRPAGSTGSVGPNLDETRPSRQLVIDRVTNGKGGMPSFKGRLTDAEIRAVADFVAGSP